MRTSLNELQHIEEQLQAIKKEPNRKLIWEAQLLADPKLKGKVFWQNRAYQIIRYFGRKELKYELNVIHKLLMTSSGKESFQEKVRNIFSP